ncbi:hypothetical protein Asp14428_65450 [Actinoplanes sp. NBRC 14428]|nr:hypothetical protein Asp14428_65450 [Actinoplanes sp. NBRC 14428]
MILTGWIADAAGAIGLLFSDGFERLVREYALAVFWAGLGIAFTITVPLVVSMRSVRDLRQEVTDLKSVRAEMRIELNKAKESLRESCDRERSQVYVDLLEQIQHDWLEAVQAVAILAGAIPDPPNAPQFGARLQMYGSEAVRQGYDELLSEIAQLRWIRAVEKYRKWPKHHPYLQESESTSSLTIHEVEVLKWSTWEALQARREDLTNRLRSELGMPVHSYTPASLVPAPMKSLMEGRDVNSAAHEGVKSRVDDE